MMRTVFRKTGWLFILILTLWGCAAVSAREKAAPPPPVPAGMPNSASFHYSLGVFHALQEDMGEAIREMEEARRLDPSSSYLVKELASLYAGKGDVAKAAAICKKTLEEHPDDIDARLLLGGLYLNQKDYSDAVREYRRVIELDPVN
ncbi:MAG: tetratricopeptide repeat protein, partial [Proteobacteria bacterium]|nr:tetratricopeptide repeat protein [Pseudomonadota bacterium]